MTINFQDPRLQRSRQKMASLGPESRAIFNNASNTANFADTEGGRQLKLMQIGSRLQARKNALDINRRNFQNTKDRRAADSRVQNRKFSLQKGEYKDAKKQSRISMALGLGSLIPKAYMANQAFKKSGQTSEDVIKLAKEIDGSWGGL
jgi:hypothetical protein